MMIESFPLDLDPIREILRRRGYSDLAELLANSEGYVKVSDSYGTYYRSWASTLIIKAPWDDYVKMEQLSEEDKKKIIEAARLAYPPAEEEPDIVNVRFEIETSSLTSDKELAQSPSIEKNGNAYIKNQLRKGEERIRKGDYDGAITIARTLVEAVFRLILEEEKGSEDLNRLYKSVRKKLDMEPEFAKAKELKEILSGLVSIVNGLSSLRNKKSDAHPAWEIPSKEVALLAFNAARTLAEFLYSIYLKLNEPPF